MAQKDDGYLRFRCGSCGQRLKIPKTQEGGQVVPCPKCGADVNVPLANIEAIARGTDLPETGSPGRINVDPGLLMKRLRGEDQKAAGPGSVGGPPSLRQGKWSSETAFARIVELDQLGASLSKMDEELMGQIQRIYRDPEPDAERRVEGVRLAAERRREDIRRLLTDRLGSLRMQVRSMQAQRHRLMRSELGRLENMEKACEALEAYARFVLGVEI
jgi:DNA-directed RNA polymerase subunit RPC12/RpoP